MLWSDSRTRIIIQEPGDTWSACSDRLKRPLFDKDSVRDTREVSCTLDSIFLEAVRISVQDPEGDGTVERYSYELSEFSMWLLLRSRK